MCRGCSTKGLHSSVLWAGLLTTVGWTQECGDLTGRALSLLCCGTTGPSDMWCTGRQKPRKLSASPSLPPLTAGPRWAEAGEGSKGKARVTETQASAHLPTAPLGEAGFAIIPILQMRALRFEVEDRSHCEREAEWSFCPQALALR